MQNSTIRSLLIAGTLIIIGIISVQVYWVKKAFDVQDRQFSHSIKTALSEVSSELCKAENKKNSSQDEVEQLSSNYYVVNLNGNIDTSNLGNYIKEEFSSRSINADFEYGIYDSSSNKLMFGKFVSLTGNNEGKHDKELPIWDKSHYYLGVQFPGKSSYLAQGMAIWAFSSVVLLVAVAFFAYSMFVILRQKKLSEIQKSFVNNMTHEFRTPLTTISLSAATLSKQIQNPEMIGFTKIIAEEAERINKNVEKILQMSRSEMLDLKLSKEKLKLNELIESTVKHFPSLIKSNVNIQFELQADEQTIYADKIHLTNVLVNLLDDACKYSKDKVNITISTFSVDNNLVLTIEDNGIGIHEKYQRKIFEQFYRVPTGNVHDVKGFGLGLNYVKNIINAHNWRLNLFSRENEGSKFTIYIPV